MGGKRSLNEARKLQAAKAAAEQLARQQKVLEPLQLTERLKYAHKNG
jgi:hypothetical protein